ncbi:MAG: hypothetical protein ACREK8_09110 [Gemmatimonadales bacterium]
MIAAGIVGLMQRDFTPTWSGVPEHSRLGPGLVYFTAVVSLGCGLGLLWRRFAFAAAGVLLGVFLSWIVVFRISPIVSAPAVTDGWWALGDTALMAAASWLLFAWFADDRRGPFTFATGAEGIRIARVLFGLALIPFGVAHFTYLERTVSLVPGWLPWHLAWAYATGGAFIAAGVALVLGVWPRLAATLAALQLGLFTVLVWVPIIVTGPDASQWTEFVSSWVLTAGAWVVADSFRGMPWLAARHPLEFAAARKAD